MIRQRLGLFLIITVLFLGSAFLLYSQRSGQLTIFGDASNLAAAITVDSPIDLQKGIEAGNGNLVLNAPGQLVLAEARLTEPGTAQFDIGNPEVTQFLRFSTLADQAPLPAGTSVSVQFAGSLDGVSFQAIGDPVLLRPDGTNPQRIDLISLVPTGSHYLRILVTLDTTTPGRSPILAGFSLDYEVLGDLAGPLAASAGTGPDVTTVTVNGTLPGSTSADIGNGARRTATTALAGTGVDIRVIGLVLLWIAGTIAVLHRRPSNNKLKA